MKLMIACGGTGGHIYPALALAEVIKNEKPETEIVFFGSSNRMEADMIPSLGYKFYGCRMSGMNGGVLAKASSLLSLVKGEFLCRSILKKEKPDFVVGFGNYISVPMIRAAHAMKIKTMIHEQNSYAGKANIYLSKIADATAVTYGSNIEQMPKANMRVTGNPEASAAADVVYDKTEIESFGLDGTKPFVLFMMGSLGSESVSKVIDETLPLLDHSYQAVAAAGKSNDYQFTFEPDDRIKIVDYVNGKNLLKGCDLAVVRAGATTLAEIGAVGCASILIPSPFVPNNHQVKNAQELVKKKAAVMIEEKDLTKERLSSEINSLMKDEAKRKEMKENALKSGNTGAAQDMIAWMEELLG